MILRYSVFGELVILPQDAPCQIVDAMLATGYREEFCIAFDFSPGFIARLMEAGFLVMSAKLNNGGGSDSGDYIVLPKLHLVRSALFFENLHIKKSIRRYLHRYELRFDADFDRIVDRCVEVHGGDWLTPPLVAAIKAIRKQNPSFASGSGKAHPASFALYRNGKLAAGEFGVTVGSVYTSYSGYFDEDNAGTVQLILTARYLREHGFSFFDLGMPLPYKNDLGAVDISPGEFVARFRR
jgi:Leu/Phe-tRNA-protein transferase